MTFEEITEKMNLLEIEICQQQKNVGVLSAKYVDLGILPETQPDFLALETAANYTLDLWQKCKSIRDEMKKARFELWQEAQNEAKNMVFKNRFFVTRNYDTTNLVFAIAENNPDPEIWAATAQDPAQFEQTTKTTQLYVQAGVKYFGHL